MEKNKYNLKIERQYYSEQNRYSCYYTLYHIKKNYEKGIFQIPDCSTKRLEDKYSFSIHEVYSRSKGQEDLVPVSITFMDLVKEYADGTAKYKDYCLQPITESSWGVRVGRNHLNSLVRETEY